MTIFSKIVAGEIPAYKVAENDNYLAFLDINPLTEGHLLVIPKKEVDNIFDLDDETIFGIARKAKTEARWLEEDDEEEAIEEAILDASDDLLRNGDGDILVFLPGEREIRDVADHLRKYQGRSAKLKHIEVCRN